MNKYIQVRGILVFSIMVLILAGCASGTKITTSQEKYSPSFRAGDYSRFKGKKVVMSSFYNQAQNTKTYSYFSPDKKLTYEFNVSLEQYYMNCFQKAFRHIGVNVVDYAYDDRYQERHGYRHGWWWGYPGPGPGGYKAPKGVAEFQFIMLSVTDQEFKFKVLVFKDGNSKLEKEYTVTMAQATTDNPAELEKRAHQMADLAFTAILRDKEFQRVF